MNYHFMVDDKFIDGFIADAELVSPGKNMYIIEGDKNSVKYVRHPLILFVNNLDSFLSNLINQLVADDMIFIHWMHYRIENFIVTLPAEIKVGMLFWGGDIVQEPKDAYKKYNYEPLTRNYFDTYFEKRPDYLPIAGNMRNILRNAKRWYNYRLRIKSALESKYKSLSRLDYFLHWSYLDYEWIKKRVKNFRPDFIYNYYDIGLETDLPESEIESSQNLIIWLGNSAAISNNHLDALKRLSYYKENDIEIICPLSYGDKDDRKYTQAVIEYGKSVFGNKFRPITEYLPRSVYYTLMQQVDIVVMYQNRSQAVGNSAAFMLMGKKIFFQDKSTFYQLLKQHNAEIYLNSSLGKLSFKELKAPLQEDSKRHNINVLNSILNRQKKLQHLAALLN